MFPQRHGKMSARRQGADRRNARFSGPARHRGTLWNRSGNEAESQRERRSPPQTAIGREDSELPGLPITRLGTSARSSALLNAMQERAVASSISSVQAPYTPCARSGAGPRMFNGAFTMTRHGFLRPDARHQPVFTPVPIHAASASAHPRANNQHAGDGALRPGEAFSRRPRIRRQRRNLRLRPGRLARGRTAVRRDR